MSLKFFPLVPEVYADGETIDADLTERIQTFRAKIPGGWLLLGTSPVAGNQHVRIAFVPDADHTWNGESLP